MTELESLRQEIYRMQADMRKLKHALNDYRPLNVSELATALNRGRNYPAAMRRAGFQMPGGKATLHDAKVWLSDHPDFRVHLSASGGLSRRKSRAKSAGK